MAAQKKLRDELRQMRRNYLNLAQENAKLKETLKQAYSGVRNVREASAQKWDSFGKLRYKTAYNEEVQRRERSESESIEKDALIEKLSLQLADEQDRRARAEENLDRLTYQVQGFVKGVEWVGTTKSLKSNRRRSNGH
jgi:hypothetical protein